MPPLCSLLEWDTNFFGFTVARLNPGHLDERTAAECLAWCAENRVRCLYFLADSTDAATIRVAEQNLFRFVDTRVTYEINLPPRPHQPERPPGEALLRPATPADLPALQAIARDSFRNTRFYFDPGFPRPLCDRLYEIWVEKSCGDPQQRLIVAEWQGAPAGFVAGRPAGERGGQIALIGVQSGVHGKGLGNRLVQAALQWFEQRGLPGAIVVTQGRNIAAQRLYQKSGFLIQSAGLWYHRWFEETTCNQ